MAKNTKRAREKKNKTIQMVAIKHTTVTKYKTERETYFTKRISNKSSALGFWTSGDQHKKTRWLLASRFLNILEMTTWNMTVTVSFALQ